MRNAIAAVLILASCGTTMEETGPQARICSQIENPRIESNSICMSAFRCDEGGAPWFQLHLCFCWDNLCMCFVKKSSALCESPFDESCGLTGGAMIIGPGTCSLKSDERNRIFFPEQNGR